MKKSPTLLFFIAAFTLLGAHQATAQQDALPLRDHISQQREDTPWLFKIRRAPETEIDIYDLWYGWLRTSAVPAPYLSFERKVSPTLSVAAGLLLDYQADLELGEGFEVSSSLRLAGLQLEPRWYFRQQALSSKGLQGNNLNGPYLGLALSGFAYAGFPDWAPSSRLSPNTNPNQFGGAALLNLGYQRRVGSFAFFEFKIGAGSVYTQAVRLSEQRDLSTGLFEFQRDVAEKWHPLLQGEMSIGLAIGHTEKGSPLANRPMPAPRNRALRLDIGGVVQGLSNRHFLGAAALGYEVKLGGQQLSLLLEARAEHSIKSIGLINNLSNTTLDFTVAPRYYYNLNKRIQAGKTTNGFDANYVGLRATFRQELGEGIFFNTEITPETDFPTYEVQELRLAPVWGIQRDISKSMYMGWEGGPLLFWNVIDGQLVDAASPGFEWHSRFSLGFVF
ncbi:hypothetical protein [Phaeodactylibacter luteus]|uniref:Bacterial surface antigen (D15) domain-containing protein n=1 Tax=Phaeodactylibacter luteus TaxID=1564516 RepID=A0A5C6RKS4_9BACT|nr:hypothetical protein [Phaeodactylibacter luteus]TXB62210.1 hypothetical protein FRY97_15285 [Phaeodactylibacter luteus]